MSAEKLKQYIEKSGQSVTAVAREFGVNRRSIHRYLSGERKVPKPIELLLHFKSAKLNRKERG